MVQLIENSEDLEDKDPPNFNSTMVQLIENNQHYINEALNHFNSTMVQLIVYPEYRQHYHT